MAPILTLQEKVNDLLERIKTLESKVGALDRRTMSCGNTYRLRKSPYDLSSHKRRTLG